MTKAKATVSIDERLLEELDGLVENDVFESRSAAIESAVRELLDARARVALETELARLDPAEERLWAELGIESAVKDWEGEPPLA